MSVILIALVCWMLIIILLSYNIMKLTDGEYNSALYILIITIILNALLLTSHMKQGFDNEMNVKKTIEQTK